MFALPTLLTLAAVSAAPAGPPPQGPSVEILQFTATWCGPCKKMYPVVRQLQSGGYPIRLVDLDRERPLARRFRVERVPTTVILVDGREVDRVEGAVAANELVSRLARHRRVARPADRSDMAGGSASRRSRTSASEPSPPATGPSEGDVQKRALDATVRIRVQDAQGNSYGTGTIVDVHGSDALVLTCGHIFRDSAGKGRVLVDLFPSGTPRTVAGQLIRYDLDRDVALVALRSDVPLRPVSIAGPSRTLHVGERVFSIGCNRGQAASVMAGTIRAVNQYLGPDNVTVTGEPVDGRSGGGLFSADGRLIGVCNAADPESHEGLYAAFGTVHKELDAARLSFVYRRGDGQSLATVPSRESPSVPLAVAEPAGLPGPAGPLMSDDTEVICIIRPKNDPDGRAHVVVLDRPSREFVAQLQREHTHQDKRQTTDLRTDRFGRPQRR